MTKGAEWAKIGFRDLAFNKVEKGQLLSKGDRKYVTTRPCPFDEVELVVREHDGKSKTQVSFCKVGPKGHGKELKEWVFNDDSDEKKNDDQKGTFKVDNAKGYFFVIILDSQSVALTFDYTVKLSGKKTKGTRVNPVVTVK
jgi:hypothetical protein